VPLINCPSCNKSVSSDALSCPACGHPLKKPKKPLFTKPAGCAVQLVGAGIILFALTELTKTPPNIAGAIFPFLIGVAILLLGRKTR
jgi:hypothetical protein